MILKVTKEPKMAEVCQLSKKVISKIVLWVGKGVEFLDRFVISISNNDFGQRISPDFAGYSNLSP